MVRFLRHDQDEHPIPTVRTLAKEEQTELLKVLELARVPIDAKTQDYIDRSLLTKHVVILFHRIFKVSFTTINEQLHRLQSQNIYPSSRNEDTWIQQRDSFKSDLKDLFLHLTILQLCVHNNKGIMQSYIEAIKTDEAMPSTSIVSPHDDDDDEMENDEIDEEVWSNAYLEWITRIVRQTTAAGLLTSLSSSEKKRFLGLNFDIADEEAPNTTREFWETTIKKIYTGQDQKMRRRVLTALRALANGDKEYAELGNNWENTFKGAIHCEAMIAVRNFTDTKGLSVPCLRPKVGVSKRCCVTCTLLLDSVVESQYDSGIPRSSIYVGPSHKIWPIALPKHCPVPVAQQVADGLDEALRKTFENCIDALEAKALPHSSAGSGVDQSDRRNRAYRLTDLDSPEL